VQTVAVTKWEYTPKPGLLDLPNTTDGRRRVPGLPDWEASITVHVDTLSSIDTDLQPGVAATFNLYTDGTKKFGPLNGIVGEPKFSSEVEGSYDMEIPFMMAYGKTLPGPPA
jgi:hypothetical protein